MKPTSKDMARDLRAEVAIVEHRLAEGLLPLHSVKGTGEWFLAAARRALHAEAASARMANALCAVLLMLNAPVPWGPAEAAMWTKLTGYERCDAANLCSVVRKALAAAEAVPGGEGV